MEALVVWVPERVEWVPGVLPVLLRLLLGLGFGLDLWGAFEPTFAPVLAW